ncbi:MAG: multidrug effflux MFS transporter [Betaproteobacteria bacterium]|nr:multidrug effflux MFS transporter [Betaproteobacteria bacterium]
MSALPVSPAPLDPTAPAPLGLTLLLGLMAGLSAFGMDMYLPSLPGMARELAAGPGAAQLTVTTYLLGLAAGQFTWGPVSDRYGRKPALLFGMALFFAASLACSMAQSMQEVAVWRLVQGIGMSGGPVIARSVVRDLYAREQAAQLLGRMTMIFGLIPVFGPLVGAQAIAWQGWPTVFWAFSAAAAALLVAVAVRLPETAPAERGSMAPRRLAANFALLLGDRRFLAGLAPMLSAQMAIIAFVSSSALVAVEALGLTPAQFSLLFATVMLGQLSGGYAGSRLVGRKGIGAMVRVGVRLTLGCGLLLAALALAGVAHWASICLPMLGFLLGCAFVVPNATAAALSPFPHMAGAASSLLGMLPFALGALVSAGLGVAFDGTTVPMACTIALFGALAFAAERLLFRRFAIR